MPMVPVGLTRPVHLEGIAAPAIVLPTDGYGQPFLVLGSAETAVAVFLAGPHKFSVMPAVNNRNWDGLVIENVAIEVDTDFVVTLTSVRSTPGVMFRKGRCLEIGVYSDDRGFRHAARAVVESDLPEGTEGLEIAFPVWRAVIRKGDRIIFEYGVTVDQAKPS